MLLGSVGTRAYPLAAGRGQESMTLPAQESLRLAAPAAASNAGRSRPR